MHTALCDVLGIATPEMRVSPLWKRMIVEAGPGDAVQAALLDLLLPPYNRPHHPALGRVLRTPFLEEWSGRPGELAGHAAELIPALIRDVLAGGGHERVPFAGQSVGLIHQVRPAGDIVQETVREATDIFQRCRRSGQ